MFFITLRFRTPNIRRSILESSPCTPTPFRSALAMQEAKYGPVKLLVRNFKNITRLSFGMLRSVVLAVVSLWLTWRIGLFPQNSPLEQHMIDSIKQEPMECAIDQPPLKKIKQEVLYTQNKHMGIKETCRQMWDWDKNVLLANVEKLNSFCNTVLRNNGFRVWTATIEVSRDIYLDFFWILGGVPVWEEPVYAVGRTRAPHTALLPKRPRTGSTCKLLQLL